MIDSGFLTDAWIGVGCPKPIPTAADGDHARVHAGRDVHRVVVGLEGRVRHNAGRDLPPKLSPRRDAVSSSRRHHRTLDVTHVAVAALVAIKDCFLTRVTRTSAAGFACKAAHRMP